MGGSWSMDDVAAAGNELEARAAAGPGPGDLARFDSDRAIWLGSDADLMLGPDLTRERARHRPAPTRGSKAERAKIKAEERARARRELFHQNAGVELPRAWWPGRPRLWWGWAALVVWALSSVVMWVGVGLVNVSERAISESRRSANGRARRARRGEVAGVVWLVLGLALAAATNGSAAVVGAVVVVVAVAVGRRKGRR